MATGLLVLVFQKDIFIELVNVVNYSSNSIGQPFNTNVTKLYNELTRFRFKFINNYKTVDYEKYDFNTLSFYLHYYPRPGYTPNAGRKCSRIF